MQREKISPSVASLCTILSSTALMVLVTLCRGRSEADAARVSTTVWWSRIDSNRRSCSFRAKAEDRRFELFCSTAQSVAPSLLSRTEVRLTRGGGELSE